MTDLPEPISILRARMSRRVFLALTARSAALVAIGSSSACALRTLSVPIDGRLFSPAEEATLRAVQDHMLPSTPDSPGARDVNALDYLDAALRGSDVDPRDLPRIRAGARELGRRSRDRNGLLFESLSAETRELELRAFEEEPPGEEWLTLVMGYLLEAYVGDPIYGGNPDGRVWKWLGHHAGYPRPLELPKEGRR